MNEYWFARRHPLRDMRPGLAPLDWRGWAVVAGFAAGLGVAAVVAWWFAERGQPVKGVLTALVIAVGAWAGLARIADKKGDHVRSVAEYREDARHG